MANPKWLNGKVRWFDKLKGDGLIRSDQGDSFYFHYSSIESKQKTKHLSLERNQEVQFKLHEDSEFTQVLKVREVI